MPPPAALFLLLLSFAHAQYRPQNYPNPQFSGQQQQNPYQQRPAQQGYQQNGFGQPQQQQQGFGQTNGAARSFQQQPQQSAFGSQQSGFNVQSNGQQNPSYNQGYNQQSFYNQQSQFQAQQQQGQKADTGRSSIVNQPVTLTNATSYGATAYFRLISYSNPNFLLSNTTSCRCPSGLTCSFLPSGQPNRCNFGFVIIFSSADQSATYISTDFYPYTDQGLSSGNWSLAYNLPMTSKPVAIDVFVQNLGEVIDISQATPSLAQFNYLTHVDTFVQSLIDYTPAPYNGQLDQRTVALTGQDLKTQIQFSYAIQCNQGAMGPSCDLTCTQNTTNTTSTSTNTNAVICFNNNTGAYYACTFNSLKTQVTNCQLCQNGPILSNGTCSTYIGQYIDTSRKVSRAFRTWTIVLGCLLGISVLFLICLIIAYIIIRNRDEGGPIYKSNPYPSTAPRTTTNQSSRPLLDDEWSAPPRTTGLTRAAPLASEHETSRTSDVRDSESYARNGHANGHPTMSRQEHQV